MDDSTTEYTEASKKCDSLGTLDSFIDESAKKIIHHQNFPEENNNIADHIYSRDFLVLVQTIVKVLHAFQHTLKYLIIQKLKTTEAPVPEAKLKKLGLERNNNLQSSLGKKKFDSGQEQPFKMTWQPPSGNIRMQQRPAVCTKDLI